MSIYYKKGFKYDLTQDADLYGAIGAFGIDVPTKALLEGYFFIDPVTDHWWISRGYSWDGATGVWDTKAFHRASLFHDCGYQAIRLGLIPAGNRGPIDDMMLAIAMDDASNFIHRFSARFRYLGVRKLAAHAIRPSAERLELVAP